MLVNPSFPHRGFAFSQNVDVSLHDPGSSGGSCWHLYMLFALKSRFARPRDFHSLPPPPGVAPPSTSPSSDDDESSSDDSPPETRSAPCAISKRVSSTVEVCRRSARAAARSARASSEAGPTVMRLATARAANWGAAKLRSKRKSGRSGPIRTAGRTGAFFSD